MLNTTPGGAVILGSGAILSDTAILSGGYSDNGSLTFELFTPANTLVDIETVAVNGNGSYSTPVGFLPTSAGTYQWDVTYSGDGNNKSASEVNATNEQQSVVGAPEPGSLLLLGTGLVGGIGAKRRRFPK